MTEARAHRATPRERISSRRALWPLVLLCLAVPWLDIDRVVLGLPAWAAQSLFFTLAYAVAVAILLPHAFDQDGPAADPEKAHGSDRGVRPGRRDEGGGPA